MITSNDTVKDTSFSLRLANVSLRKGDYFILRDINIELQEGQFVSLIGGSGFGKSALVSVITGMISKEFSVEGCFEVNDFVITNPKIGDVAKFWANSRRLSYMSPFNIFPARLTLWEIIVIYIFDAGNLCQYQAKQLLTLEILFDCEDADCKREVFVMPFLRALWFTVTEIEVRPGSPDVHNMELNLQQFFSDMSYQDRTTIRVLIQLVETIYRMKSLLVLDEPTAGLSSIRTDRILCIIRWCSIQFNFAVIVVIHQYPTALLWNFGRVYEFLEQGMLTSYCPEETPQIEENTTSKLRAYISASNVSGGARNMRHHVNMILVPEFRNTVFFYSTYIVIPILCSIIFCIVYYDNLKFPYNINGPLRRSSVAGLIDGQAVKDYSCIGMFLIEVSSKLPYSPNDNWKLSTVSKPSAIDNCSTSQLVMSRLANISSAFVSMVIERSVETGRSFDDMFSLPNSKLTEDMYIYSTKEVDDSDFDDQRELAAAEDISIYEESKDSINQRRARIMDSSRGNYTIFELLKEIMIVVADVADQANPCDEQDDWTVHHPYIAEQSRNVRGGIVSDNAKTASSKGVLEYWRLRTKTTHTTAIPNPYIRNSPMTFGSCVLNYLQMDKRYRLLSCSECSHANDGLSMYMTAENRGMHEDILEWTVPAFNQLEQFASSITALWIVIDSLLDDPSNKRSVCEDSHSDRYLLKWFNTPSDDCNSTTVSPYIADDTDGLIYNNISLMQAFGDCEPTDFTFWTCLIAKMDLVDTVSHPLLKCSLDKPIIPATVELSPIQPTQLYGTTFTIIDYITILSGPISGWFAQFIRTLGMSVNIATLCFLSSCLLGYTAFMTFIVLQRHVTFINYFRTWFERSRLKHKMNIYVFINMTILFMLPAFLFCTITFGLLYPETPRFDEHISKIMRIYTLLGVLVCSLLHVAVLILYAMLCVLGVVVGRTTPFSQALIIYLIPLMLSVVFGGYLIRPVNLGSWSHLEDLSLYRWTYFGMLNCLLPEGSLYGVVDSNLLKAINGVPQSNSFLHCLIALGLFLLVGTIIYVPATNAFRARTHLPLETRTSHGYQEVF